MLSGLGAELLGQLGLYPVCCARERNLSKPALGGTSEQPYEGTQYRKRQHNDEHNAET